MLPLEFTVQGTPASQQSTAARKKAWKDAVEAAARQKLETGAQPVKGEVAIRIVYYHDGPRPRIDVDNMIKPVQDALTGLIWADDRQVTDSSGHRRALSGSFTVRGMSRELADAFVRGTEFMHVIITDPPDPTRLLR